MDRRGFLATGLAAGVSLGCSLGRGRKGSADMQDDKRTIEANGHGIERRPYGSTGEMISILGFGGIIVDRQTPAEAANYVAEAVGRGINYFDVATVYGQAQERLGPALKPYRDRCFLACKTEKRDAVDAEKALHESFRLLKTDYFDLYQLHSLGSRDDVEKVFGPGGAMEVFLKARQAGQIRYLGFSAHSEEAALLAMERFDFDSILFPLNFAAWHEGKFGPAVLKRAREKKMGVLALKSMAHQKLPEGVKQEEGKWKKCWYEPLDEAGLAGLALRFTLGLPVDAAIPPGHWELFKIAMSLAETGAATRPLSDDEHQTLRQIAKTCRVLFKAERA